MSEGLPSIIIRTATGRQFSVTGKTQRRDEGIAVADIAAALARTGWQPLVGKYFYSLAQRSCLIAKSLADAGVWAQLYGLFHHAADAYLGHVPFWAKSAERGLLERATRARIHDRLGLGEPHQVYQQALAFALASVEATESRDGMGSVSGEKPLAEPLRTVIIPWLWPKAEKEFVETYQRLARSAGLRIVS